MKYPELAKDWHQNSNYLCQLSVMDEEALYKLVDKAERKGITYVPFFEPDIGNQLTAIAIEPTDEARKLVRNLPLMLSELQVSAQ